MKKSREEYFHAFDQERQYTQMHRRQGSSQWKESCWKWDRMLQDLNTLISSACHIFIADVVSSLCVMWADRAINYDTDRDLRHC